MDKLKIAKIIRKMLREKGWPTHTDARRRLKNVDYRINERAEWAAAFAKFGRGGKVALCRSGMDCDCTQYSHVTHMDVPKSLFAFIKAEEEHREWLDGPESTWLEVVEDAPEEDLYSDRALEAYEEGHASHVTWAAHSELRPRL
jgi:hypothetical protein